MFFASPCQNISHGRRRVKAPLIPRDGRSGAIAALDTTRIGARDASAEMTGCYAPLGRVAVR